MDGVLLVIKANTTPQDVIVYSKRMLANANARVLGVVFNNVPVQRRGYGYGYHGYGYGYYYGYGEQNVERGKKGRRRRKQQN